MLRLPMTAFAAALMLPAALALTAPATGQQKTTIGVSLAQDDNPFYIAMLRGIRARAQELGWEVATVSANEDKLKQMAAAQPAPRAVDQQLARQQAARAAPNDAAEQERLFKKFLEWSKTQAKQ